jgi:predicted ATP-binding protein involved in virulence
MRITRIFVEKLFGIFDHEIRLNLDDRITIIHAPNGYGKTVILKMLDGLFNARYFELITIPYRSFNVEFDDGTMLEVCKKPANKGEKLLGLSFTLNSRHKKKSKSFVLKYNPNDSNIYYSSAPRERSRSTVKDSSLFIYTVEHSPADETLNLFGDRTFSSLISDQEDQWIIDIRDEINVYLIESQRLLNLSSGGDFKKHMKSHGVPQSTVNTYSDELIQEIRDRLAKYASVSQSLDRSFPQRVLRQKASDELTGNDLRNKWDALEKHRNRLVDAGLLEKDEEQNLSIQSQQIDESTKNLLAVYIEDVEKKLDVFGDIAAKIDLFRRIINSKFSYKEIVVSREKGFIFRSKYPEDSEHNTSELLSPSSLSSGEQHELILLYELLFKVKEKSLVLIDEPELSLHIGWQVNFLKDLQEISKLADLDLLIATHAPSLINDRWDLTVELKGVS